MNRAVYRRGAAALAVVLGLGLFAVLWARHQYGERVAAGVWPQGRFEAALTLTAAPETRTLLLLGDSRMAEWGVPQLPGWRTVNAGVRGITTAQLAMCSPDILRRAQPQVVVIQAGINDLKLLGVLAAVVTACRQAGAQVIVTVVWPPGPVPPVRRLVWSDAVDPAVVETNRRLRNLLADEPGVRMVDFMGALTAGVSQSERFGMYRDTLHLKPETYARLSALLGETMASYQGGIRSE